MRPSWDHDALSEVPSGIQNEVIYIFLDLSLGLPNRYAGMTDNASTVHQPMKKHVLFIEYVRI